MAWLLTRNQFSVDTMSDDDVGSRSTATKLESTRESNRMAFKVHHVLRKRRNGTAPHLTNARVELHGGNGSPHLIGRMQRWCVLPVHESCVNTLRWNQSGSLLASGGDDRTLVITRYPELMKFTSIETGHTANIFCVGFVPKRNQWVATCSGDRQIRLFDIEAGKLLAVYGGHQGRVRRFVIPPSTCPYALYSCSDDGTVKLWDLRTRAPADTPAGDGRRSHPTSFLDDPSVLFHRRSTLLARSRWPRYASDGRLHSNTAVRFHDQETSQCVPLTSIAFCDQRPEYFVIGGHLPSIWLLDRRMMTDRDTKPVQQFHPGGRSRCLRTTGVNISYDGTRVIGSWSDEFIYQFETHLGTSSQDVPEPTGMGQTTDSDSDADLWPSISAAASDTASDALSVDHDDDANQSSPRGLRERSCSTSNDGDDGTVHASRSRRQSKTPESCLSQSCSGGPNHRTCFKTVFKGHCNVHTIKEVQYLGPHSDWVASGSDDGRFFIWDAFKGRLRYIGHGADSAIVNCIAEHPVDPVLATSGISSTVKLWRPGGLSSTLDHKLEATKSILWNNKRRRQNPPRQLVGLRRLVAYR